MKICLVVATSGRTGVESVAFSLARGLQNVGVHVTVVMFSEGPLTDLLCAYAVDHRIISVKHEFDILKIFELSRFFKAKKFDVIHAHGARAAFFSSLAALLYKSPSLTVSIHELSDGTCRSAFVKGLENALYRWIFKKCVAVSKAVEMDSVSRRSLSPSKVVVIPNCLPCTFSERLSDYYSGEMPRDDRKMQHDLVVGVAGRLDTVKGHKYIIQAWPLVMKTFPAAMLKIAGLGPLKCELESMSLQLGIRPMIQFLGSVKDMVRFYSTINILVLPSLSESFGMTILEAMSCGIPVIACDVGGVNEIVTNEWNGLLVPSKSPKAIAQAILRLCSDHSFRKGLISNGLKTVESYKEETFICQHLQLYESFL
jgi:L-malate glycosyltransferase